VSKLAALFAVASTAALGLSLAAGAAGTAVTITKFAAHTGYAQKHTWAITKTAQPSSVTLPGDGVSTAQISYAVTVSSTGSVNTGFVDHDSIGFSNPGGETVTGVSAVVSQDSQTFPATISQCPLPTTGSLICHYDVNLLSDDPFSVTAKVTTTIGSVSQTVTVPNFYANLDPSPFTPAQIDTCVSVSDTNPGGPQNQLVCLNTPPPVTFNYKATVGPYSSTQCGSFNVSNTATFTTNDTGSTGSATANVAVSVPCQPVCTYTKGFYKNHLSAVQSLYGSGLPGTSLSLAQVEAILTASPSQLSPGSGGALNLAQQALTALLNEAKGAAASSTVNNAISAALSSLSYTFTSGKLTAISSSSSNVGGLTNTIDGFNQANDCSS
jgi:hypothetical protein